MAPSEFLEHIVILCFERRYPKQNSVIRLKSNILAPSNLFASPPKFRAGHATEYKADQLPAILTCSLQ